jgi:hypothetical protein
VLDLSIFSSRRKCHLNSEYKWQLFLPLIFYISSSAKINWICVLNDVYFVHCILFIKNQPTKQPNKQTNIMNTSCYIMYQGVCRSDGQILLPCSHGSSAVWLDLSTLSLLCFASACNSKKPKRPSILCT